MDFLDILPILIYLILLLYLGFQARRKNANREEFLLGSRSLSLPAFIATLVATWYGGILGVGEFVFTRGLSVWFVFGLPYYFFGFVFAFVLAPKIRSAENYSIPDMLYRVYNKPIGLLGSSFLLIMTSPAPYILMIGVLIQYFFQISFFASILIGTTLSIVYVYWGGFRSVVQTDILQFILMFLGFSILFYYLLDHAFPISELPSRLDHVHRSLSGGLSSQQIVVWFLIASWTFIDPGFHQRCAAAKTPQIARRGILISIAFWFIFDMLTLTTGLYSWILLPDANPLMSYPELAQLILPPFLKGIFIVGLLATIMSTVDSYTFLSALTFGQDILSKIKKNQKKDDVNHLVRLGLSITAIISVLLILMIPSVVQLWYHLGSLFIPPLLLPLLASYFPPLRIPKKSTFLAMTLSFMVSFFFFCWGTFYSSKGLPDYPLALEPFFPGLVVSILWFGLSKIFDKKSKKPASNLSFESID